MTASDHRSSGSSSRRSDRSSGSSGRRSSRNRPSFWSRSRGLAWAYVLLLGLLPAIQAMPEGKVCFYF